MTTDPTQLDAHFAFGQNWADYSKSIDEAKIAKACEALTRLVGADLSGKAFLDIGCGSGIHALAALRLGAASVTAVDIDPNSVSTTRKVLSTFAPDRTWRAEVVSVLSDDFAKIGTFDVVYSWGVLHHTGDMNRAVANAAKAVKAGGIFCIALYAKTPLCGFWKLEKRIYSRSSKRAQAALRGCFYVWLTGLETPRLARRSLQALMRGRVYDVRGYFQQRDRGMNFYHDVHDWLGGYPYESATPEEVEFHVSRLGFRTKQTHVLPGYPHGLQGSGCNEYIFEKI